MIVIQIVTAILTACLAIVVPVVAQTVTDMPTSTSSADPDFETIKENVKKRLQDVVLDNKIVNLGREKVVYIGKLKSRAGNTFSIETDESVKLASVSAETKVVRIPPATNFTLEDISLEDFLIALGYKSDGDVLEVRKIIDQKNLPAESEYQLFYGKVSMYSPKDYQLQLENPYDNSSKRFTVSRKATIHQALASDNYQDIPRNKQIPLGTYALAVYLPAADDTEDNVTYQVILRTESIDATISGTPNP